MTDDQRQVTVSLALLEQVAVLENRVAKLSQPLVVARGSFDTIAAERDELKAKLAKMETQNDNQAYVLRQINKAVDAPMGHWRKDGES